MVWTANRDHPSVSSNAWIELSASGRLVLHGENLVLHGENSDFVWESFTFPTDTIVEGQILASGHQLLSRVSARDYSTGRFRLKMQPDENLAAYPLDTQDISEAAYWASGTSNSYGYRNLHLDNAGRLKLQITYNSSVFRQLNSGNYSENTASTSVYRATLDPDGNFRVYSNTSTELLWSALNGTCEVKGLCGLNSYCASSKYDHLWSSCYCLPGTDVVVGGGIGCRRNFGQQKCRDGKANATFYHLTRMQSLIWYDHPYFNAVMSSEEDCNKSCLDDCYCDAAQYDEPIKYCSKYAFPLKYANRYNQTNHTSFFKIGRKTNDQSTGLVNGANVVPYDETIVVTSKKTWLLILIITLSLVTYSCVALAVSGFFIFKARVVGQYTKLLESGASGLASELTLRLYTYKELKKATKGFKEELGKGSFDAVYKGTISTRNGEKLIAVKRLQKLVEEGEREFQSEMRVIGKTHHKNLVRLLGYCTEGSNRLLVYEYMSNGSLADLIFQSERRLRRPHWHERVRIALDVARGILYLHQECEAPIIHCDIKPQNILMDEFWTSKIADFGLAKLLMPDQTRTFTDTRGTRGYVAPEWQKNVPITLKVDVYSYGIVLLEIICCRKGIDVSVSRPEEIQLSGWAYSCFAEGELGKLVGDEDEIDKKSLERMVTVALWCIQSDPILRPSMKGVVLMLEGFTTISTPPCPTA